MSAFLRYFRTLERFGRIGFDGHFVSFVFSFFHYPQILRSPFSNLVLNTPASHFLRLLFWVDSAGSWNQKNNGTRSCLGEYYGFCLFSFDL
jgi:hypothetical protein